MSYQHDAARSGSRRRCPDRGAISQDRAGCVGAI